MKRALQLFYCTLLTFCIIGNASAATYSIDWNAYSGSGWYVLDLDQRSTYPIAEAYMRVTYDLNGSNGVFTHYFNGIESSWSFIVNGIEFSGVNPSWDPSSQTITPAMSTTARAGSVLSPDRVPMPAAVPIPSAIWLLGSAFIGLVGYRKKVRKT